MLPTSPPPTLSWLRLAALPTSTFTADVDCVTLVLLVFRPTTPPATMPPKLFGLLIVPDTVTLLIVPGVYVITALAGG